MDSLPVKSTSFTLFQTPGEECQLLEREEKGVIQFSHKIVSPLSVPINSRIKRCVDVFFSLLLILLILSWITPILALLIKCGSRGPVFFKQKRNGEGNRLFHCIKFRTMRVNNMADHLVAKKDDERITPLGHFLRRHHLDELPQLFNVLKGEMSLVGPRPYMIRENRIYQSMLSAHSDRHAVKPGITGLAQSYGYYGHLKEPDKIEERLALDIYYIQNWRLGLDVRVIWRTLVMSLSGRRSKQGQVAVIQM